MIDFYYTYVFDKNKGEKDLVINPPLFFFMKNGR